MASKTKTSTVQTPASKASSPMTPKPSRPGKGVTKPEPKSPSPVQHSRQLAERSPRTSISKPALERRSPKIPTPPEKSQARVAKATESPSTRSQVHEELKKAKEQIALLEKEKAQAVEELGEAKKWADEASKKRSEALTAHKQAEDSSEFEKFRAIEQGLEAAQKKEEEWKKEFESLKNQHDSDKAELERVKRELAQALSEVDNANKTSEIHVQKIDILSSELTQLKAQLDSRTEKEGIQGDEAVSKRRSEVDSLTELDEARNFKEMMNERDVSIKQLSIELEAVKKAKLSARESAEELRNKVEELEVQVEELKKSERCALESLETVTRQLKESNTLLKGARSELAILEEKLEFLETTKGRQRQDLQALQSKLDKADEEAAEMAKNIESLEAELESTKDKKLKSVENEKLLQDLLQEKNKLERELRSSREEEEKSKKAMESLASALHEVSTEARDLKERLFSSGHGDHVHYETQIEDLKLVIKATNEKYENLLEDARHQIEVLTCAVEHTKYEFENSKAQWEEKEAGFLSRIKKSEEELPVMQREINRLANMLKWSEEEARAAKEEQTELKDSLKEVEDEVLYLQETLGETKAESMKLKENLQDKETELQSLAQENEELRDREADSLKKIEELSRQLEDAKADKTTEENGEITDSEKDYDLLPKVVEFSEENGHRSGDEKNTMEVSPSETASSEGSPQENINNSKADKDDTTMVHVENGNGKPEAKMENGKDDSSVEVIFKMWESCKIDKKEALPEKNSEQELPEEEADTKVVDGSESFDYRNGLSSLEASDVDGNSTKREQQLKKKRPFMQKFGNLLKKKGSTNQK